MGLLITYLERYMYNTSIQGTKESLSEPHCPK